MSVVFGSLILVLVAMLFMLVLRKKLTPEPIVIDINGRYNPVREHCNHGNGNNDILTYIIRKLFVIKL